MQQDNHLLVRELMKVVVKSANRAKLVRLNQEQCLVAKWPKRLCNLGGYDRYGKDEARSLRAP